MKRQLSEVILSEVILKGVKQEHYLLGILICAIIVATPSLFKSCSRFVVLNRAIKRGEIGKVTTMLNAHPYLLREKDKKIGATPLHWAVIANHREIVELLIKRGADINAPDKHGLTPLHKASSFNRPDIVDLLLWEDADLNARGLKYNAFMMTPLHLAAEAGFSDVVKILLHAGADPDVRTEGTNSVTALHISASRGHYIVVRILLENGADVNAKDIRGKTPLSWARMSGQKNIEDLLLVYGGKL